MWLVIFNLFTYYYNIDTNISTYLLLKSSSKQTIFSDPKNVSQMEHSCLGSLQLSAIKVELSWSKGKWNAKIEYRKI